MDKVPFKSNKQTIRALFFWIFSAALSGAIGTSTVYIFMTLYKIITDTLLSVTIIPIFIYPVAGALIVGSIFYRLSPESMGEGIPSYLEGLTEHRGFLEFKETFFKFWAALFTLSTFGNGGFIGPVGRVSAGIMSAIGKIFAGKFMKSSYIRLYSICGLSAAIGALLHSPIGAGFAGMLSSTMNTPIATAIITLELFGFAYSLPAGIASIIGFQVNRKNTLYDFALKERESEY